MVLAALFIALVFLATAFLRVPSPLPNHAGQIHTGTALVFIISVVYGAKMGAISTIGMVLFNLFFGLAPWAPINLVVRPIMAFLFAWVARAGMFKWWANVLAALLGGAWMVFGMYVGEVLVFQIPWGAPIYAVPGNVMQVVLAIAIGIPLIALIKAHKRKL